VTNAAPWSARYSFGAVALNDQIWVLGGSTSVGFTNDVWFLNTDTWEWSKPAVTGTPPPGRFGHLWVSFGRSLA